MKVIAMYLPQYHEVEENNKWWGQGYTDWFAVRNARSLYAGHRQPKAPLDYNYYDLMRKETVEWQAGLMKKYGIYGFCFYHYWFKDGVQILEKPAENLLSWKDIDLPYCFCWANESWVRSWNNIGEGNLWMGNPKLDSADTGNGFLLQQKYGNKRDWEKHFNYLLPFFKDDRYIKLDNKPVFVLYKPDKIMLLKSMVKLWNELAVRAGFNGIYMIGANAGSSSNYYDAVLIHEPQATILQTIKAGKEQGNTEVLNQFSYEDIWNDLLQNRIKGKKVFYGGFVNFDDTPRRGKSGTVISEGTPQQFEENLTGLYAKNIAEGNEFLFINAWNEWGEGMYLEPDIENRYAYLEAFHKAAGNYNKYLNKYEGNDNLTEAVSCINTQEIKLERYESYWKVLNKWMLLKEMDKKIADCLMDKALVKIAVYGMGMLGKHLLAEMSDSTINIVYAIDRNYKHINMGIPVISPEDEFEEVDAIIITTVHLYGEISSQIAKKADCEIISLENLLDESF